MSLTQKLTKVLIDLFVMTWDLGLAILNFVLPKHETGHVIPAGIPGHNGQWPEYVAPRPGDSRSACPMLNAMVRFSISRLNGIIYPLEQLIDAHAGKPWHSAALWP